MSVSIEQYRARIGSHGNFVEHRELNSLLKNDFWNTMLMLFYMNAFYLPTLKRLLLQRQSDNETVAWLIQTLYYYHVYVPLLLRLSNDVETTRDPQCMILLIQPQQFVQTLIKAIDDLVSVLVNNALLCR